MRVLAFACFACSLLFVHVSLPRVAAAQGRGGSGEDAEYRNVVEEALQEYNRGNWEEAAALFERAHRLNPSARTLRGMGLTAYEARRYVDAIRYLSEALTETRRALTAAQREEVSGTLERARRFVAHLRLKIGPSDARVTINGRPAEPDARGDVTTDPGLLDVEITADGYESALRRVRLTAGGQEELAVQLSRTRTEAPPAAQVTSSQPQMAPVAATQPTPSDSGGGAVGPLKWVVGGVAVAGLIAGGVLVYYQGVKADEYKSSCRSDTNAKPDEERLKFCNNLRAEVTRTLWYAPIITFSVAGALAATATVLFVVDATDDGAPETARSGCGAGPGDIGVQCRVVF